MKKKKLLLIPFICILSSCDLQVTKNEVADCENTIALEYAPENSDKSVKQVYCDIETTNNLEEVDTFIKNKYNAAKITEFLSLPYYHSDLTERYIAYDDGSKSVEDIVTQVNIGLDQPYFTNVKTIEDTEDTLLLVNKYNALPENYEPTNLVSTPNACVIGVDYSCQTETQYLRKEVGEAFSSLVNGGKEHGINIKAIASYRSYSYQKNLYDYYANTEGKEYADKYYARPGQSEHNSALAVDVTLNNENFNEIENSEDYDWLINNIANYGFILRYPKDKVEITGYQYESWHLRYVGVEAAQEMTKQNLTLDEYIARKEVQE